MDGKILVPSEMVALAGEYHVLAQLAERNIRGALTIGPAKSLDILAHNPVTNRHFRVEVKTTSRPPRVERWFGEVKCHRWMMSASQEQVVDSDLIYCFVGLNGPGAAPKIFVVPASVVGPYLVTEHAQYNERRGFVGAADPNSMRTFRIPETDPEGYSSSGWDVFLKPAA